MNRPNASRRADLVRIATETMVERGLEPEFSLAVARQLAHLEGAGAAAPPGPAAGVADLTALPWCSIDNDDSRDLDQLTVCEPLAGGVVRVLVAVADVDVLVAKGKCTSEQIQRGKEILHETVSLLVGLIRSISPERLGEEPFEYRTSTES